MDSRVPLWYHLAMMQWNQNPIHPPPCSVKKWQRVKGKSLSVYKFSKTLRPLSVLFIVLALAALTASPAPAADEGTPPSGRVVVYTKDNALATPRPNALPLKESVSEYGIAWTFEQPACGGHFGRTQQAPSLAGGY